LKYLNYVEYEACNAPLPFDFKFMEFISPPPVKIFETIISYPNPFQWSPQEKEHPPMQDIDFFPLIDDIKIITPIENFTFPLFDIEVVRPPPDPPPPTINKTFECSEPDPPNFCFFYGKTKI
jgi:hypothetical protein